MTLTSYRYKLQFVYDIINGKQSIADARKIFSDEWAAFYGLYVNISTAEQKLMELNTFMHGMNAYSIQMAQKFFETLTVEIYNDLEEYYKKLEDYEKNHEEDCEEDCGADDGVDDGIDDGIDYDKDISVMYISELLTDCAPGDVLNLRDDYFRELNYRERNPYIRSIKRNAFNAFLKKWNYI